MALPVIDAQLAKHPTTSPATSFSLADVSFMPYVEYGMMTPLKETFAKYPHFMAWWNRVSERPSWRQVAGRA